MPPTSVSNGLSIMRLKFDTDWLAANPTVLIAPENFKFTPTYDANERLDAFVRPRIQITSREQKALTSSAGTKMWRTSGIHSVAIFTAHGEGDGAGLLLAEAVQSVLEGKNDTGVQWRATNIVIVGEREDAFQINTLTEFYFDTFS